MKEVNPKRPNTKLTLTVGELITELQKYDKELPVVATWEGVGAAVHPDNFNAMERKGRHELEIDVEDYG